MIWGKIKAASADARRKDEEYHARAMHKIQAGNRRDGLWAKAMASAQGEDSSAKLIYFKLLVQAIRDDEHLLIYNAQKKRGAESSAKTENSKIDHLRLPSRKRPGLARLMLIGFLLVIIVSLLSFGVAIIIDKITSTPLQALSLSIGVLAIFYAIRRIVLK